MTVLEMARVDRVQRSYSLAALFPTLSGPFTAASIALLPPRTDPNGSTVFVSTGVTAGSATPILAGPDASSTGAIVVTGNCDVWVQVTVGAETDAAKAERVNVLGGATVVGPGPLPPVTSVVGQTGPVTGAAIAADASVKAAFDASGAATAAQSFAIQRANHTGTQVAATISDLGTAVAADPAVKAAYAPLAPQFHGIQYQAFGHSFGQVQNPVNCWAGSVYPARLRDLLHTDPALYGNDTVNGNSMSQTAANVRASWVQGAGGLVSILSNQNSVGNHEAPATYKSAVRSILSRLLNTAAPPTILVYKDVTSTAAGYARYGTPPTDADVATYNGYLTSVVAEFPGAPIIVADPLADGWNPATMTGPDGQHPNDAGQAHIAASGLKALAASPYRAGLNRGFPATPPSATVYDYYDRADSATSLGSTPTGQAYTVSGSGGVFGISNGEAYKASGSGEDYATASTALADVDITVTLAVVVGAGIGPVWRYSDANNLWTLDCSIGSNAKVYKKVGGSFTQVADLGVIAANGDRVRIVAKGAAGTAYVNGVQVATFTDSFNSAATSHGLRSAESNAFTGRLDGLLIKAAP